MNKHQGSFGPPREKSAPLPRPAAPNIPAVPPVPPKVESAGLPCPDNTAKIMHTILPMSDFNGQDRYIEATELLGFTHYESLILGGNEILLRFRKKGNLAK